MQPCDGHYQRQTNQALVYALQTEIGIPAGEQTGTVGPTTRESLPTLGVGNAGSFVELFQYALYFNGYSVGIFDGIYGNGTMQTVMEFQEFTALDVDGIAGKQTWLSALISTGDPDRRGTASDGITEVTPARAQTLVDEGYVIIGRYLTNVPGGLNKRLQPDELQTIFNAGLSVYPIFQESHANASNFSYNQGYEDYQNAFQAAASYGFPEGTTIYFAVDFDVLGHEITNAIIPHFSGLNAAKNDMGNQYNIGIYGPRNACIQVSERGYADYSFVSGLSTGFSGNLGFPLPDNWSFDQISTITIGTGAGAINIDNNINSGRDSGVSFIDDSVEDPGELPVDPNTLSYAQFQLISSGASSFANEEGNLDVDTINYLTSSYYRKYAYTGINWTALAGPFPQDFADYVEDMHEGALRQFIDLTDPIEDHVIGVEHLFAVINGQYGIFGDEVTINDITGWAGDLITVADNVVSYRDEYEGNLIDRTYAAAYDLIGMVEGQPFGDLLFDLDDLLADVDAYNITYEAKRLNVTLAEVYPDYYTQRQNNTRFNDFFNLRFNGEQAFLLRDAISVMTDTSGDYALIREELIGSLNLSEEELAAIAQAFYSKIIFYVDQGK
ncbi:glycoside hydrolase domain-containing protein [Virgibacillus kimchii]